MRAHNIQNHIEQYKQGNYQFGRYLSQDDIISDMKEGKTFVIKGNLIGWSFVFPIIAFIASIVLVFLGIAIFPIFFLFAVGAIIAFIILFLYYIYAPLKSYLAIGPNGIEFDSAFSSYRYEPWDQVADMRVSIRTVVVDGVPDEFKLVRIYFKDLGRKKIETRMYGKKQFPGKNREDLVADLFSIYWEVYKRQMKQ